MRFADCSLIMIGAVACSKAARCAMHALPARLDGIHALLEHVVG